MFRRRVKSENMKYCYLWKCVILFNKVIIYVIVVESWTKNIIAFSVLRWIGENFLFYLIKITISNWKAYIFTLFGGNVWGMLDCANILIKLLNIIEELAGGWCSWIFIYKSICFYFILLWNFIVLDTLEII